MNKKSLLKILVPALLLSACTRGTPTAIPTVVLDSSASQGGASDSAVSASGEVIPVRKAQLSFPLTGSVASVEVRPGDEVKAGQALVVLDTTILEAQVKQAEADLAATETQLKYLIRIGTDQEHLDSAQADIDRAQAALDSAQATLGQATLTAPFDGTIAAVDIAPAETVVPGQIAVTLGDLSHFQIETTDLSERDVPNVKIGQTANVFIDALGEQFTGEVIDIARISSTIGGDVVYKVTIELDSRPAGLLWGMSADVEIPIEN
jgi:RND family efflux transporter MFP subunit